MKSCKDDLYALVSQLFHINRKLLQGFLIDYLRVSKAQKQAGFIFFDKILKQLVNFKHMVEKIQITNSSCEPV